MNKETTTKLIGLGHHLTCNFYPPLPKEYREDIMIAFRKYWSGEISIDDLWKLSHMKNAEVLYDKFYIYLNPEDIEEE